MEVLGVLIGCVGNCLPPHASSSYKNIKRNWKELEEASNRLDARKKDIDEKLKVLVKPGVTKETNEVLHWLKSVEEISKVIDGIKEKVKGIKFYARAGCGKEIVEMTRMILVRSSVELYGRALVQELPQRGIELPTTTILEDETFVSRCSSSSNRCVSDDDDHDI